MPKRKGDFEISYAAAVQQHPASRARATNIHRSATGRLGGSTSYHDAPRSEPTEVPSTTDATSSVSEDHDFELPQVEPDIVMGNDTADAITPIGQDEKDSSSLIEDWLPHRARYLDELLRHDGRRGILECVRCRNGEAEYRCQDCFSTPLFCEQCVLEEHRQLPLHTIQYWEGTYFKRTSLQAIGLVIQLGHEDGQPCACPEDGPKDFTIVSTNGIHQVTLQYCGCHHSAGGSVKNIQLLRASLFPATIIRPRTAFTFDVLNSFHLLTLQGKTSSYDYFISLCHKSDNTTTWDTTRGYDQFRFVMRIWRHLKLVKRAGRCHDPKGVDATVPGDCAVECPACPHPERNLPAGWEMAPEDVCWLYRLILTMDANFQLKNKARRGVANDKPLGDGWGHWVPEKPYHAYVQQFGHQVEPNLCDSDLHAVDHANTRFSSGYNATGSGGVLCARHTLVRKNGLGDLQKGERYANMDFILFFTLIGTFFLKLLLSYDIICQYSRNLGARMKQFPSWMRIPGSIFDAITYVIPKFHIYGHGKRCQTKFSLNFLRWSGRTNGEDPERWWAHINPVSMSTKEMSPGAHHDTIDDHAAAWNWHKIVNFGASLLSQLEKALFMYVKHKALFDALTETFKPELVAKWEAMVVAWEKDMNQPDPYSESDIGSTMADLRLELAKEEMKEAEGGRMQLHETSPNMFLQIGLELEQQQRILVDESKGRKTTLQTADLQEKRNAFRRRIEAWRAIQAVYMPAVNELPSSSTARASEDTIHPEMFELRLPSAIPANHRNTRCLEGLPEKERRLRVAQADDSLRELQRLLRVTMGLRHYKFTQVGPSQRASTRTRSMIGRFKVKIDRCVDRYRAARRALISLDPTGDWTSSLLELKDEDIRTPRRNDDDIGEGSRTLSWIWLVRGNVRQSSGNSAEDSELNDSLRIEWARSRARAARWKEDIQLLTEEMRRVLEFFQWRSGWWLRLGTARSDTSPELRDGLSAYAAKQRGILQSIGKRFGAMWWPILSANDLQIDWPDFIPEHPTSVQPTSVELEHAIDIVEEDDF